MRNEPLDCRVYAYAALCSFGRVHWGNAVSRQQKAKERAAKPAESEVQQETAPKPQQSTPRRAMPRPNFVTGWRR
jgi:phage terminase large subunit GpA-like protein